MRKRIYENGKEIMAELYPGASSPRKIRCAHMWTPMKQVYDRAEVTSSLNHGPESRQDRRFAS